LRSGGQSAGAVAFEIPIEALNQLATAGGRWQEVGLGKTGEVYIVGPDGLMRSESRRWLEDPDGYLSQLRADPSTVGLADRISALRTTVLIQPVDSPVVADALDGVTGTSRTTDYLGRRSLAFATPIESEGLGWAVVAEISDAEAGASLRSFRNRLLVVAAFLLPIAGLLGFLIADRFTRPIGPVVEAAQSIAEGDLDTSLPDLGSNELGDVARRLEDMAAHLRDQEEQLAAEEQEITRMLLAALPARLVERLRSGDRRIEDLVDSATVISVTITGVFDQPDVNPELAVELGTRISSGLETAADDLGIERVRSSSAHHLFVSGLDAPGPEADAAVNFALAAQDVVTSQGESDAVEVGFHAGLAAGRIVSGLVPGDYLSYGVFGEAVHLALTLDASASDGEILAHRSVVSAVEDDWAMEPARELVDLSGSALEASRVAGRADDLAGRVE
jgi:class 3 adenylate cyclase